jgi:hypothetical protein
VAEELLDHSPAAHVRRPRLDYESHAVGLDRNELGALLVAAGLGPPAEHALISLLALNGLRVSEATGAGVRCAVEFNCLRWGSHDLPPQAGIAVCERGQDGLLAAVRVYDDIEAPIGYP